MWYPKVSLGAWYRIYPELDKRKGRNFCCLKNCECKPFVTSIYVGIEWGPCKVCDAVGSTTFYLRPQAFYNQFFSTHGMDDIIFGGTESLEFRNFDVVVPLFPSNESE